MFIRVHEFYCKLDEKTPMRLLQLHTMTTNAIEIVANADAKVDFILYSPDLAYRILGLAGAIILRISRANTGRAASLLTQLWGSHQVFRQADGTFDSLRVRLRNRGVSSPVFHPDSHYFSLTHFTASWRRIRLLLVLGSRVQGPARSLFKNGQGTDRPSAN